MGSMKSFSKGLLAAGAVAVLSVGCVSNAELEEVRATANEALQKANSAEACCRANEEKFDRMFKKSMYK